MYALSRRLETRNFAAVLSCAYGIRGPTVRQTKKNGHPRCPFQCCCYDVLEAVLETYADGCLLAAQRGSNDALAEVCITVVLHLVIGDVDFRPLGNVSALAHGDHLAARATPVGSVPVDGTATSLDVIHRDKREVQRMRP